MYPNIPNVLLTLYFQIATGLSNVGTFTPRICQFVNPTFCVLICCVRCFNVKISYTVFVSRNAINALQCLNILLMCHIIEQGDRDSSVGTATRYGLDGPAIESRWGRDFPHSSRQVLGLTQPPVQGVPGPFPGGKAAGTWRWLPTPYLMPSLKEE